MNEPSATTLEFSHPVATSEISPDGTSVERRAKKNERAKLSTRLGLEAIDDLFFKVRMTPEPEGNGLIVEGRIKVRFKQTCSVTTELIESVIDLPVTLRFEETDESGEGKIGDIDIDDEDPPEPMIGGRFDLGETMVQLVAQEIDPFPRKPGLPYADFSTATGHHEKDHAEPSENPFAVLENLKDKLR